MWTVRVDLLQLVFKVEPEWKKRKTNQMPIQSVACVDTLPSLRVLAIFDDGGFPACFRGLRCGGGSAADLCLHPAEGRDWSEATV